jgi:hypothetical protein
MRLQDRELRAELETACASVRHQIELHERSMRSMYGGQGDRRLLRELRDTLTQLEEARAGLGEA